MDSTESTQGFKEWEQIQEITSSNSQLKEWEIIDDSPVFPPIYHEGLEISPQFVQVEKQLCLPSSSSSSSLSSLAEDKPHSDSRFKLSKSKVHRLVSYFGSCVVFRGGFWLFGSATGVVMVLVLLYVRVRWRWRRTREDDKNQLLLILKEKDEKINQLLLQIAQMKVLLSHKVPVHRIR